jgi:hypothetical protein
VKTQTISIAAAFCAAGFLLSACSSASQSSPLGLPETNASVNATGKRPAIYNAYVKIDFDNKTRAYPEVWTYWAYPFTPFLLAEKRRLDPETTWQSHIGFELSDGEVMVRLFDRGGDVRLEFKNIKFTREEPERATITTYLDHTGNFAELEFCGLQTYPVAWKRVVCETFQPH